MEVKTIDSRMKVLTKKHTIIISQDKKGNFITKDESHYINAILNSCIVHSYIHSTFKTNGFSLKKSNLCIPKFDNTNRLHNRLVILSKYASLKKNEKKRERVAELASKLYVMACEEQKTTHVALTYELPDFEPIDMAAEDIFIYGSIPVDLPNTKCEELANGSLDLVLMYAIGSSARQKTEAAGKIALGIKERMLKDEQLAAYKSIKYLMFHYWSNPKAYQLTKGPELVDKNAVPSDYLIRMKKDAVKYLLLDYAPPTICRFGKCKHLEDSA